MIKVFQKQPLEAEQFDGSNDMIDRYGIIDAVRFRFDPSGWLWSALGGGF